MNLFKSLTLKILVIYLFIFLLPGCASQRAFSRSFPDRLTEAQNEWRHRYGGVGYSGTPALGGYLQEMLDRLVYVSPLRGYPLRVVIVSDPAPNAFTDGLTVFVTTGLLAAFQHDEDLIASVLAHELGHILGHHVPDEKSRASVLEYLSYLTPALSALPYGGWYGNLTGAALREGAKMRRFSYNRLQENEADAIGTFLAAEAGYNPRGLSFFLDESPGSGWGRPRTLSVPLSASAIPHSALVTLLSASPLYKVHPPSSKRKRVVWLMHSRHRGDMTHKELMEESRWIAELYTVLENRSPGPVYYGQ